VPLICISAVSLSSTWLETFGYLRILTFSSIGIDTRIEVRFRNSMPDSLAV
jgi:hypothetical protein